MIIVPSKIITIIPLLFIILMGTHVLITAPTPLL